MYGGQAPGHASCEAHGGDQAGKDVDAAADTYLLRGHRRDFDDAFVTGNNALTSIRRGVAMSGPPGRRRHHDDQPTVSS